ncbi:hypothetical protein [Salinisphaera hydrothermalis]|uniref:hypothetical protein n=1 Tax=Salinisphaera hydrothermalis TaxID=563188 RepID=UPI003342645C
MKQRHRRLMLPVALGLSDGILNALMLAANRLQGDTEPMTLSLSMRIAVATAVASIFMLFVAEYAQLRQELEHADLQLNVLARGRMATSRQGRAVAREASVVASISGVCAFVGSGAPLLVASVLGASGLWSLAMAVIGLGLLGALVARAVHGSGLVWTGVMMLGGGAVSVLGIYLHIV